MALSGTISKTISGSLKYKILWSATQNVADNTSTITCKHYLTGSSYSLSISSRSNTCSVGGVSKSYTSSAISGTVTNRLIGTTTHAVTHNSDGSKSVTIKGVFNIQATLSGTYISSVTASSTVTLDAIPRAATITSAPNFTDEDNPTIGYSNPAGSAVSSLQACISSDGYSIEVPYRDISITGTSYTFSLTDAEREALQSVCTTAKSRTVYFYVKTVMGSETYLTKLAKTLTIANAEPALSPTVADSNATTVALTGSSSIFVKGQSNAAFTIGATALKGATITGQSVACGSQSSEASASTLFNVESAAFTFTATDSRGYVATQTLNKTLVDYVKLTCTLKVNNPTADGEMAMSISGAYFNGSFGAVANTLTVQYRMCTDRGESWGDWVTVSHALSGNSYSAAVEVTGLDYQLAYTIQARAVDALATIESAERTVRSFPVFDWGEGDFNFNVPVHLPNSTAIYGANASGTPRNLVHINALNESHFGYGGYAASEGSAYYEGNEVYIRSKAGTYVDGCLMAQNKILWSGAWYMNASQTATLSEAISTQAHGIVLRFAPYVDSAVGTYGYVHVFIPKHSVALHSGGGHDIFMFRGAAFARATFKYLYISDTTITGISTNTATGTNSGTGITYDNSYYVLTHVIGV